MSDDEIIIYLHDLAREFQLDKMRIVADRFSELSELSKTTEEAVSNIENKLTDWQKMKDQGS